MKKERKNLFKNKVLSRIRSQRGNVVLWEDLYDLGGSRQISRALNKLIDEGQLIRIGRGIYAKAKRSKYLDQPIIRKGFDIVCIEALKRLGIKWELGQLIKDYNEGKSQQVPARLELRLKNRFRRTLAAGNNKLNFEGNVNAK